MPRRPRPTVEELVARFDQIPGVREHREGAEARRLQKEQEYTRLEAPMLAEIAALGFMVTSLWEIVNNPAPLPPAFVEALLAWLPRFDVDRLKEGVVRCLTAACEPFDGRPLVDCYNHTRDEGLKWAILNTVACAHPHSIDDWLEEIRDTTAGDTLQRISRAAPDGRDR